ncbi:MAG TPA: hypothetical protein VF677_08430 [Flavobacterium sp.]
MEFIKPIGFKFKTREGVIQKAYTNWGECNSEPDSNEYKFNSTVVIPGNTSLYKVDGHRGSTYIKLGNY